MNECVCVCEKGEWLLSFLVNFSRFSSPCCSQLTRTKTHMHKNTCTHTYTTPHTHTYTHVQLEGDEETHADADIAAALGSVGSPTPANTIDTQTVVTELVRTVTALEKTRPLDKKMKYKVRVRACVYVVAVCMCKNGWLGSHTLP